MLGRNCSWLINRETRNAFVANIEKSIAVVHRSYFLRCCLEFKLCQTFISTDFNSLSYFFFFFFLFKVDILTSLLYLLNNFLPNYSISNLPTQKINPFILFSLNITRGNLTDAQSSMANEFYERSIVF